MSQKEQEYKLNSSNTSNKNSQHCHKPFTSNQIQTLTDDNNNNFMKTHLISNNYSNLCGSNQSLDKEKKQNHLKNQHHQNSFDAKRSSSSGNSSLNSSSSSSAFSSRSSSPFRSYGASLTNKNNEYKRNINSKIHRIQPQPISSSRQVRFKLDDPSYVSKSYNKPNHRSASLTSTSSRRSLDPLIQTVGNELNQIKQSLDAAKSKENEKIQHLLKSIYDDDLKDAHLIMSKLTSKLKHKSDVTNDLFLTAYNQHNYHLKPDDVAPSLGFKSNNLKPTSSSKSKSVLMPQCKSLHSLKAFEKSKTLNSRDDPHKIGIRQRSASLLNTNRLSDQNDNDDLVYILNNLKSSSFNRLNCGSASSLNW